MWADKVFSLAMLALVGAVLYFGWMALHLVR